MMYEAGLYYRRMNIWYYENGFSRTSKAPLAQYEPFLWFSKSKTKWTYNVDDVRIPYKSEERLKNPVYYKNAKGERKVWKPNPLGAMRGYLGFSNFSRQSICKRKDSASYTETGSLDYGTDKGILPQKYRWKI